LIERQDKDRFVDEGLSKNRNEHGRGNFSGEENGEHRPTLLARRHANVDDEHRMQAN
jgi:hypothetical protein